MLRGGLSVSDCANCARCSSDDGDGVVSVWAEPRWMDERPQRNTNRNHDDERTKKNKNKCDVNRQKGLVAAQNVPQVFTVAKFILSPVFISIPNWFFSNMAPNLQKLKRILILVM